MIKALAELRWSILGAAIVGAMVSPVGHSWWRAALSSYDEASPVVVMRGELIGRDADAVFLRIEGQKLRNCTYLRVQAYAKDSDGQLTDAYLQRVDRPERGDTKPTGNYSIGAWRVWPATGAAAVLVYVQHDCDGRLVVTKIAEVAV